MNSRSSGSSSSSSSGIGVLGLVQAAFIILHFVPQGQSWNPIPHWSWWQILIPTFIGVGIVAVILVIFIIGAVIAALWGSRK
ncbi:hypothetical protein MYRNA_265 [Mycobacterium phage Myrna]|uniref:Uncharacterized protein n=1 Tax=Mycobacterium phage Myrna TaxID=546805 RepID=B5LJN5_9CAUD|nr:gp265 [Mycobacterium phage Myrna]ACH62232.1 hypothetical protein MYRNA_265 [Mycobacterium phage Myrna]